MGNPYLNSGETIVLTTSRVSVETVPYDMMLTTERVFFIDNRNTRFEPRIISLSTILSVQGGKTAALDPVITLLFRTGEGEGDRQPLNIVFSQAPNENRKPERDNWVRSFIQMSINQHERNAAPETPVVPDTADGPGLRPKSRHGVAPDKVRPLSNVTDRIEIAPPVTVIPEEVEGVGDIPAFTDATPVGGESPEPGISAYSHGPVHEPQAPAAPERVIIPQIIEELLPENQIPALPGRQEPAAVAGFDPKVLFRTVPTAARSVTVTEERSPPTEGIIPEPSASETEPDASGQEEVPEIIKALRTGNTEPAEPEQPALPMPVTVADTVPDTAPEPVGDSTETEYSGVPEPEDIHPVREKATGEPPVTPPRDEQTGREPAPEGTLPVRHPIPPAREIRQPGTALMYGAVLLIVIVLAAAGAVLLLPPGPGQDGNQVTPTPTVLPITTPSPETLPTTIAAPAVTPATTPVPPPGVPPIAQAGVWIRVNSTSYYFGSLGNTELMRQVSGSGDNFYQPLWSDRPVQVSIQKNDNSGAALTVTIYRDGTPISTRSVTSPMGAVNLLIDPRTGRAPGLTANDTLPDNEIMPTVLENY